MDMEAMKKMMEKKKSSEPLDENYKGAKMSMLKELHKHMTDMMADGLKDHKLKKVSVMADSKDGLADGLDKAKELLGHNEDLMDTDKPDGKEDGITDHDDTSGDPSQDDHEHAQELQDDDTDQDDDLDAQIQALMEKKKAKMSKMGSR